MDKMYMSILVTTDLVKTASYHRQIRRDRLNIIRA